jgi:Cys-rich four helix bundle protein (predicted Tat secretion target)
MNRREMFLVGGSTAAAHVLWTTLSGCGAQSTPGGTTPTPPASGPADLIAERTADCVLACERCITASIAHAAHGMTDMLECLRMARDCAALCRATNVLAAAGSSRLAALAALCAECCDACAAQCRSHAAHEPACGACADACTACAEACRAA